MLTYKYYRENKQIYNSYKGKELIPLDCCYCKIRYSVKKRTCRMGILYKDSDSNFCSKKCQSLSATTSVAEPCASCSNPVLRNPYERNKTKNVFCNNSCAAKYNNTHKTTGNRRSKLESYLEEQLRIVYPDLQIIANGKEVIESELDLYFPELKFAVELNGIFHYEPIYGQDKLEKIQNNDKQKFIKCYEAGIELMILDTSKQKRFTVKSSSEYLDIIKEHLNSIMKRKEPV